MQRNRIIAALALLIGAIGGTHPSTPMDSGRARILAAGRGNPLVNLLDGIEVPAVFSGPDRAVEALRKGTTSPRAMASADFDEDGTPDLLCSFVNDGGGGILTLHRGNVDAVYPNTVEARQRRRSGVSVDAPFLPDVKTFETPAPPDLVGAGDFDADGHQDVVTAAIGTGLLFVLAGDGEGGLGPAERIALPGEITAMTTGEINRRDGLADIVVAVRGPSGSAVLVYEWPEGALRGEPEILDLPAPVTDLVLGPIDGDPPIDLAVAAGSELVLFHGRDRRLSLGGDRRAEVPPATVDAIALSFAATSIALGDFDADNRTDIALLDERGVLHVVPGSDPASPRRGASLTPREPKEPGRMRLLRATVSSVPGDDLVVMDSSGRHIHLIPAGGSVRADATQGAAPRMDVPGEPVAVLPMRLNADVLDDLVVLAEGPAALSVVPTAPLTTFTVTNTNNTGAGSLRQTIINANATPGPDMIAFDIPGPGPHTIQPVQPMPGSESSLPYITETLTIDGTTEPDYAGTPVVEIDGSLHDLGNCPPRGLLATFDAPNTLIRGLAVNRFVGTGTGICSGGRAIEIQGDDSTIEGNFIGTDTSGMLGMGNAIGVIVFAISGAVTIGGTAPPARNVIVANRMQILADTSPTGMLIQGNLIGTDRLGTAALDECCAGDPTPLIGIHLRYGVTSSTIGGTMSAARNIIATKRGPNVQFSTIGAVPPSANLVQGNYIGTDITGTVALSTAGNEGVFLIDSPGNTVGGTASGAGNLISGNGLDGVLIDGPMATMNLVQGNRIGTDAAGAGGLGNGSDGVHVSDAGGNAIGGAVFGARNLISANGGTGIRIAGAGSTVNTVQGNYIGTDVDGTASLGNSGLGVFVFADDNTIGGPASGEGNLVSGNALGGLEIFNGLSNTVQGNFIGTDRTGLFPVGNLIGVRLSNGADGNLIGGPGVGEGNLISGNDSQGLVLQEPNTSSNRIEGNRIGTVFASDLALPNGGVGISIIDATANVIGGIMPDRGNTIAFNGLAGIFASAVGASNNMFLSNRIFSNGDLGIDLNPFGVTLNDPGDADVGPNELQNFPVIVSASTTGGQVRIEGSLDSTPGTTFTLQFFHSPSCDPSGHGEGRSLIDSLAVMTDGGGHAVFSPLFGAFVPAAAAITATATNPASTSEFSQCALAEGIPPIDDPDILWPDPTGRGLSWGNVPGADFFNVYEGVSTSLGNLQTADPDSCRRAVAQGNSTGDILTQTPPPGETFWYVVVAENQFGEGGAGQGFQGPRILNSVGDCSLSCAHDKCVTGQSLAQFCDPCVASLCEADAFCCDTQWDGLCVQEVRTVCGSLTCAEGQGQCAHTLCAEGVPLAPGCDDPPLTPSCVEAVCASDPHCCQQAWDGPCVEGVTSLCGFNCN